MFNIKNVFLKEDVEKFFGNKQVPIDVLNFLVSEYCLTSPPKIQYSNLSDLRNKKDFENAGGAYFYNKNLITLNEKELSKLHGVELFKTTINIVLHEIGHVNQYVKWKNDLKFRLKFTQGYLPGEIDVSDLKDINDLNDILNYWEYVYPYDEQPHEIDAWNFAEKYLNEAIRRVLERENSTKKKMVNV